MGANHNTFDAALVVRTIQDLEQVWVAELDDGATCWVESGPAFFTLNKFSGLPPDAVNIVQPGPGSPIAGAPAARWIRGLIGTVGAGAGLYEAPAMILNVGANPDGSIIVNPDDVQVGVLATDAQHGIRGGGALHALVVPAGAAGFMSGADKSKLDGLPASAVPTTRTLFAGAGLVGGGDLSADRTFDVVANADGSIVVNPNDVQVGVLASDAQHGIRGGGTQHALVVPAGAAGFMSGADKATFDTMVALFVPSTRTLTAGAGLVGGGDLSADRTFDVVANADGSIVVNANDIQVGVLASDAQHGIRGGGTQHAVATAVTAGFMSAADKSKLDGISTGASSAVLGFGANSVTATVTTRFLFPWYEDAIAMTSAVQYRVPRAGTLKNMRVRHGTTAGNGNAIVYTLRVNSVATALTISIASTSADGSDLVHSVVVAAGDLVDIIVTKALAVGTSPSDITLTMEMAA